MNYDDLSKDVVSARLAEQLIRSGFYSTSRLYWVQSKTADHVHYVYPKETADEFDKRSWKIYRAPLVSDFDTELPNILKINGKITEFRLTIFKGDIFTDGLKQLLKKMGKKVSDEGYRVCYIDIKNPPTGIHNEFEEGYKEAKLVDCLADMWLYLKSQKML